jgi:outer membrane protein assembly factor BamB
MARLTSGTIYVGIRGHVVALDRRTGDELWRTHLKGASFVYVQRDEDLLLATCSGEVFALRPRTGELVWHNRLKGMGMGFTTVIGDAGAAAAGVAGIAALEAQRQAAAAAAAT